MQKYLIIPLLALSVIFIAPRNVSAISDIPTQSELLSFSAAMDFDQDATTIGTDADDYAIYVAICGDEVLNPHMRSEYPTGGVGSALLSPCTEDSSQLDVYTGSDFPTGTTRTNFERQIWRQVTWPASSAPLTWGARASAGAPAEAQLATVIDWIQEGLVTDICTNIDGEQLTMPDGYEDPEPDGTCTQIDLCDNLDGIQWPTLPTYYEDDNEDGTCSPLPADAVTIAQAIENQTITLISAGISIGLAYIIVRAFVWKP